MRLPKTSPRNLMFRSSAATSTSDLRQQRNKCRSLSSSVHNCPANSSYSVSNIEASLQPEEGSARLDSVPATNLRREYCSCCQYTVVSDTLILRCTISNGIPICAAV